MGIKDQVMQDMKAAMLARDEVRLGALRLIKAEFLKAEKEKGLTVDEDRAMTLLQTMVKQRRDSISQFEQAGRTDLAAREEAELKVIQTYLPEALSADEIKSHVDAVLAAEANPDPKQVGKLMGAVMARLKAAGKPFDAKLANQMVRERLGL